MEDQPTNANLQPNFLERNQRRRNIISGMFVLVLVLLVVALWRFPMAPLLDALRAANLYWLAVALAANLAVFPFWVWQWRVLATRFNVVTWPAMTRVVALSLGARVTVSGLGGVASGGAALHLEAGLSPQEAASVMTLDQVLAGLTKVLVLVLALAFVPLPEVVSSGILDAAEVIVALSALFAVLVVCGRWSPSHFWRRSSIVSRLFSLIAGIVRDLREVTCFSVVLPAAILALSKKALEVLSAYAIQIALGIEGSWALALLVVASVGLVSLLPFAPVQLGPQALAVFSTYSVFDTPTALAVSAGVMHQAVMLLTLGAIGLAVFAAGSKQSRLQNSP